MTDPLVEYELAALAKEIGFNEPGFNWFDDKKQAIGYRGLRLAQDGFRNSEMTNNCISRPTFSLLHQWFMEKHLLFIEIRHDEEDYFTYKVLQMENTGMVAPKRTKVIKTFKLTIETALIETAQHIKSTLQR